VLRKDAAIISDATRSRILIFPVTFNGIVRLRGNCAIIIFSDFHHTNDKKYFQFGEISYLQIPIYTHLSTYSVKPVEAQKTLLLGQKMEFTYGFSFLF